MSVATVPSEIREVTIFERRVPLNRMFVHYRDQPGGYARPLREPRVKKLVAEFDPLGVGVLYLSMRDDGSYWIIDGQHRAEAARRVGLPGLDAYVYIDLT